MYRNLGSQLVAYIVWECVRGLLHRVHVGFDQTPFSASHPITRLSEAGSLAPIATYPNGKALAFYS